MSETKDSTWMFPGTFYLTFLTLVLGISGFIYARTFFSAFNIEVDKFFSVQDYLSTSVDRVYASAISFGRIIICGVVGYFWGKKAREAEARLLAEKGDKAKRTFISVGKTANIGLSLIGVSILVALYLGIMSIYISLEIVCLFIYSFVCSNIILKKPRGLKPAEYLFFVSIFFFILTIVLDAYNDVDRIKKDQKKSLAASTYVFKGLDVSGLRHIGSTSAFMFFYNQKDNVTVVLPVTSLESVKAGKR